MSTITRSALEEADAAYMASDVALGHAYNELQAALEEVRETLGDKFDNIEHLQADYNLALSACHAAYAVYSQALDADISVSA